MEYQISKKYLSSVGWVQCTFRFSRVKSFRLFGFFFGNRLKWLFSAYSILFDIVIRLFDQMSVEFELAQWLITRGHFHCKSSCSHRRGASRGDEQQPRSHSFHRSRHPLPKLCSWELLDAHARIDGIAFFPKRSYWWWWWWSFNLFRWCQNRCSILIWRSHYWFEESGGLQGSTPKPERKWCTY